MADFHLDLRSTEITDAGSIHLEGLPHLLVLCQHLELGFRCRAKSEKGVATKEDCHEQKVYRSPHG